MPVEVVALSLTKDGRVAGDRAFSQIRRLLPACTDCFVFCPGWLDDPGETSQEARRFFTLLETAMRPLGDRIRPLRVALHWPSRPFAEDARAHLDDGLWPELSRHLLRMTRIRSGVVTRLLMDLRGSEVPLSPEEECELDGLFRRLDAAGPFDATRLSNLNALRFWVMKRRAGNVGERFGREHWVPFWGTQAGERHRLHLVGHSFGATLLTSSVLRGIRPESLTLLLGAFSAFAFAPEVPGPARPGLYRRVLSDDRIQGPIVALHTRHDSALGTLYTAATASGQASHPAPRGAWSYLARRVAASALGVVGARGVDAAAVDLVEAQTIGLPRAPIVNVDGSRIVRAQDPPLGAHRDIHHPEIATLVLLAAGLLEAAPDGMRARRSCPYVLA
jgi:hypothetical protein